MIKLIVCDIDGTLLNYDNRFDEESFDKINEKRSQGVEFMFATGRDFDMVDDFCQLKDVYSPLILNNGTQYRSYNGEVNHYYPMDRKSFEQVMEILLKYQYHISVHTQQGKYIFEEMETYYQRHIDILKKSRHVEDESLFPDAAFFTRKGFLRNVHPVHHVEEFYQQGALPLKIDARHIEPSMVAGVGHLFDDIDHLHISSSYAENIEITSDIHDKGSMLKEVIKEKGLSIEEVATFGDGLNDVGMLAGFPYSFAPANAHAAAKEKASYSLDITNEQGAVKKGIEILEALHLI